MLIKTRKSYQVCHDASQMLNDGALSTKHQRCCNKEAIMTYYYSWTVISATERELYVFFTTMVIAFTAILTQLCRIYFENETPKAAPQAFSDMPVKNVLPRSAIWQHFTTYSDGTHLFCWGGGVRCRGWRIWARGWIISSTGYIVVRCVRRNSFSLLVS